MKIAAVTDDGKTISLHFGRHRITWCARLKMVKSQAWNYGRRSAIITRLMNTITVSMNMAQGRR